MLRGARVAARYAWVHAASKTPRETAPFARTFAGAVMHAARACSAVNGTSNGGVRVVTGVHKGHLCTASAARKEPCSKEELRQMFAATPLDTKSISAALRGRLDSGNIVTLLELCGTRNIHPKYFVNDALLKQLLHSDRKYNEKELMQIMRVLQPLKFARPRDTMEIVLSAVRPHLSARKLFSSWQWSNFLYSMQHVDCSAPGVRALTQHLLQALERMSSQQRWNPVECAKAVYGLQRTTAKDDLVKRLLTQIHRRTGGRLRMDEKGCSMVLYGLRSMTNDGPEVRAFLDLVHSNVIDMPTMKMASLTMSFAGLQKMTSGEEHFERLSTALTGHLLAIREPIEMNDVCSILYSMRSMKPNHNSTQQLLSALASKLPQASGNVSLMHCAQGIYGLQFADFTSQPVRRILARLGDELEQRQFRLNPNDRVRINQLLAYVGFGLQRMHVDIPEVRTILEQVKSIIPWGSVVVSPKAAATFLYGLRYQPLVEVADLMENMIPCMANEPSIWRHSQLGCGFYALRRFPPSHQTVAAVRAVLHDKLFAASFAEFNDVTLANILVSFRLCRSLSEMDKDVLNFVLRQFKTKVTEMSAFSIITSLYGLAGLRSNEPVVAQLQHILTERMRAVIWQPHEIPHITGLASAMGPETSAGRDLLIALTEILRDQALPLKAGDVKRCLALINPQSTIVGAPYVGEIFDVMLAASETNQLTVSTSSQFASWCRAMFCLGVDDPRIAKFVNLFLRRDALSTEHVRAEDFPSIMLGLSKVDAGSPDGEALFLRLADVLDSSNETLHAHHISSLCYNLQHLRLTSAAAQGVMSALASKIRSSEATLDVNHMARCMFGLQHMNSGLLVSEELTQAVSARAESNNPEFWRQVVEVVQGGVEAEQGSTSTLAEFEDDNDELEEYLLQNEQDFDY